MKLFKNFAAIARILPFFLEKTHHDGVEAS
jgi:hypothetical protein